jgi:hypothetical protein
VSDVFRKVLKLSSEVSECRHLPPPRSRPPPRHLSRPGPPPLPRTSPLGTGYVPSRRDPSAPPSPVSRGALAAGWVPSAPPPLLSLPAVNRKLVDRIAASAGSTARGEARGGGRAAAALLQCPHRRLQRAAGRLCWKRRWDGEAMGFARPVAARGARDSLELGCLLLGLMLGTPPPKHEYQRACAP